MLTNNTQAETSDTQRYASTDNYWPTTNNYNNYLQYMQYNKNNTVDSTSSQLENNSVQETQSYMPYDYDGTSEQQKNF